MSKPILYVNKEGGWLLVGLPNSSTPTPNIEGYEPMGSPQACAKEVYLFLKQDHVLAHVKLPNSRSRPIQQFMADNIGVSQRTVSTWVLQERDPDLYQIPAQGVAWLARAVRVARNSKS